MASLAASQGSLHAAAPCRQTLQQRNACTAAFTAPLRHPQQQRGRNLASGSRRTLVVAAAAQAEVRCGPGSCDAGRRCERHWRSAAEVLPAAASNLVEASPRPLLQGVGKLISKVEIPAFIPRADLLDQLLRWAYIEVQENGVANTGSPCKVPRCSLLACGMPSTAGMPLSRAVVDAQLSWH